MFLRLLVGTILIGIVMWVRKKKIVNIITNFWTFSIQCSRKTSLQFCNSPRDINIAHSYCPKILVFFRQVQSKEKPRHELVLIVWTLLATAHLTQLILSVLSLVLDSSKLVVEPLFLLPSYNEISRLTLEFTRTRLI